MIFYFNKLAFYFLFIFVIIGCFSCGKDSISPEPDPDEKPIPDSETDPFEKVIVEAKDFEFSAEYWWPEQKAPKKLITCQVAHNNYPERILSESLAGIAAKAVNEGKNDELVWITVGTPAAEEWLNRTVTRLAIMDKQTMDVWQLLDHLAAKGLVKGYVVYDYDNGTGGMYTKRTDMDNSANIATSVAGVISVSKKTRFF